MEIIIGTKAWSTWSLRPWLALKATGAPFTERVIALRQQEATKAAILPHSPSGFVPTLKDGDLTIWDSLAICEYLHEKFPAALLWPADPGARALGRAAAAEMHAGFRPLRMECPMALDEAPRAADLSAEAQGDVARITRLWEDLLARFGGPFLLGDWSIADAFYTPVATRFRRYGVALSGAAGDYNRRLLAQPAFLEWERAAV